MNNIAGCNYCGEYSDSPARKADVMREFSMLRKYLRSQGIKRTWIRSGEQVGAFCIRIWLCVRSVDLERARASTDSWLTDHHDDTRLIYGWK
jgi:uncharacterized protein YqjF (DUF2071 family)